MLSILITTGKICAKGGAQEEPPPHASEGGIEGSELVAVRTDADAQGVVARFTQRLEAALDLVFEKLLRSSTTGGEESASLTLGDVDAFLVEVNGRLGRGGIARQSSAIFERKAQVATSKQNERPVSSLPFFPK